MLRRCLMAAAAGVMLAGAAAPDADTLPDPSPIPQAPAGVARTAHSAYRSDTLELPLARAGAEGSELDYFVVMKAGDSLVYSWSAEGAPDAEFYSDFHGMTADTPPAQVLTYREGMAAEAKGSLAAPFEGLHGWLFKNDSARPVTVKLTIAGFYELRSLRDAMGLGGGQYVPFGPPGWAHRYGPAER